MPAPSLEDAIFNLNQSFMTAMHYGIDAQDVDAGSIRMVLDELAHVKASDEAHWRTLRECADILCLPDESPSLLPEKIRLLQLCANSEKQAKVERGDMLIAEQEKTAKLREVLGKTRGHISDGKLDAEIAAILASL